MSVAQISNGQGRGRPGYWAPYALTPYRRLPTTDAGGRTRRRTPTDRSTRRRADADANMTPAGGRPPLASRGERHPPPPPPRPSGFKPPRPLALALVLVRSAARSRGDSSRHWPRSNASSSATTRVGTDWLDAGPPAPPPPAFILSLPAASGQLPAGGPMALKHASTRCYSELFAPVLLLSPPPLPTWAGFAKRRSDATCRRHTPTGWAGNPP